MASNEEADRRTAFQHRLTRRFVEFQGKGLNASDAASISLKMEAGQLRAPVDIAQLVGVLTDSGGSSNDAEQSHLSTSAASAISDLFSSAPTLVLSLARSPAVQQPAQPQTDQLVELDWEAVAQLGKALDGSASDEAADLAVQQATKLLSSMAVDGGRLDLWLSAQAMVVICCMPWLADLAHEQLLVQLCTLLAAWPEHHAQSFVLALSRTTQQLMADIVGSKLQQFIVLRLIATAMLDDSIVSAVQTLDLVFQANEQAGLIDRSAFYCDAINQEDFDLKGDYLRWRQKRGFAFAAHAFMYTPASKAELLRVENQLEMMNEMREALMYDAMRGSMHSIPYFVLKVRRQQLLNDTVLQMRRANRMLKRPLKVKFIGEEGVDEGGVTKEFFQILTDQLLQPDFGMFTVDVETRILWFRSSQQLDLLEEFKLVGNLVGLAVFNSVILDVTFPIVLYKKLLGEDLSAEDLRHLHPAVYTNLTKLRTFSGNFEDLGLVFQAEQENEWGNGSVLVNLKEHGGDIPVSKDNVEEYIQAYAHFLLVDSVAPQYDAFEAGFRQVSDGPVMSMLFPEELELLLCGGRDMDFHALERSAHIEGFEPDADVVRWFWETVHTYSDEHKRQLLAFVTGSDRVPINGLGALHPPFVIHRNGDASDRLPTAHTCFNALMLSAGYKDKAALERALAVAIENSEGFGLQ